MRALLTILVIAGTSYHFSDVRSGKAVQGILLPLVFFLCIVAFALWIYARTRHRSGDHGHDAGGVSVPFGSSSRPGGLDD